MRYHQLGRTNMMVSNISFGASSLGGVFRNIDERKAIDAVHVAIEHGVNYIDVAPAYGGTKAETVLGRALKGIPRSAFYISTKVGKSTAIDNYGNDKFDYSADGIRYSLDESSKRIGVDFIDIVYLHDIEYNDRKHTEWALTEGLQTLLDLKCEGRIGAVGIGMYPLDLWKQVINDGVIDVGLSHNLYTLNDIQFSSHHKDITTTMFSSADPVSVIQNVKWCEEALDEDLLAYVRQILIPVSNQNWKY